MKKGLLIYWCNGKFIFKSFRQWEIYPQSTTATTNTRLWQRLIAIVEIELFLYPIFVVFYEKDKINIYMMLCSICSQVTFSSPSSVCSIANVFKRVDCDGWALSNVWLLEIGQFCMSFWQCLFSKRFFLSLSCSVWTSTLRVIIQA